MEFVKGIVEREKSGYEEFLEKAEGDTACLEGAVHSLRDMGEIGFVILRSIFRRSGRKASPERI